MKSGQYSRVDRYEVDRLRAELDAALPPLRAKPIVAVRAEPKSTEHQEFLVAYCALVKRGWTMRAMSRHLGISHRYVLDMRRGARAARTEARDWVAALWELLGRDVELPSRTGTDCSW